MTIRPQKSEFERSVAAEFPLRVLSLPGDDALRDRRRSAFARFDEMGLPTRRDEDFHYTDLKALMPAAKLSSLDPMAAASGIATDPVGRLAQGHHRIGRGAPDAGGLPRGVTVYSLEQALKKRPDLIGRIGEVVPDEASAVVALNTAFFAGLTIVEVEKGAKVDLPLHSTFVYQDGMPLRMDVRALFLIGDGAEVTIVNSVAGGRTAGYQVNAVVELIIGDRAKVRHVRTNNAGLASLSLHTIGARLGAGAEYDLFVLNAGSALSRTEVRVAFAGEGGRAGLRGVTLMKDEQHCDVTLMVDHAAPRCESRELFRHVVDGSATAVFQGKIMVKQAAQKTDGQMASNAILLSDDAVMNNKPELEIFADDVVCAHGATAGALDEDLLFYLQARGLPMREAQALMLQAFCGEAVEFVADDGVRDALNQCVAQWLAARPGA